MAAITTRQTAGTGATVAGVPLTNAQLDNNFININTDLVGKAPLDGVGATGNWPISAANITGGTNGALPYKEIVLSGGYSINFDGTGDYLSIANHTGLNIFTADSTIEFWLKITGLPGLYCALIDKYSTGIDEGYKIDLQNTGVLTFIVGNASGSYYIGGTTTLAINTWYHVALVRSGSTLKAYLNGTQEGSTATITTEPVVSSIPLYVGTNPSLIRDFNGKISNLRIVKGTAVYTSSFTPAGPLTAITNTTLLTARYSTITDGSVSNYTITSNGNVATTTDYPNTFSATDAIQFLPIGTNGKYLSSNGTAPVWADLSPSALGSQTANTVLAAPNGSAGTPTFRALVAADIPTLNQNTTGTASNVTGTVAIANGGTGATTAQAAINALAGATTAAQFLRGNGTNVVMSAIQAADVPTLNQNTTGTASNVTGTVAIANGGTGATTAQAAINALAGATTAAQFLRGNGTNVVMSAIQAADVPTLNQNTTGSAASVSGTTTAAIESSALGTGTANSTTFLRGDRSWTTVSLPSGQTAGSSTSGYLQYSGTTATAGQINGSTTAPTNTTRLNYEGHFYATKFFGDGSSLTGISAGATITDDTTTNGTRYLLFDDVTTGSATSVGTSSTKLTFNPSTGTLSVSNLSVSGNITATGTVVGDFVVSVISTNTNAVHGTVYILTSPLTLTLPASPVVGDWVRVANRSGTNTAIIARNGNNIMSLAEDMTIDTLNATITLVYASATLGWTLI